ncbi:hypothetical protein PAPYR_8323 [Paratrimastix pyriformis]|uniref:Tc1-like transposase DDE domain-containing protein n=1 Tax=Paratrimastix pyriformis TaxID=342808 RepID=A0ABQ8UDH4_9EUKA|nr:hypothetical protein PAPYR_8323 [Paratrimastix pyriformis]
MQSLITVLRGDTPCLKTISAALRHMGLSKKQLQTVAREKFAAENVRFYLQYVDVVMHFEPSRLFFADEARSTYSTLHALTDCFLDEYIRSNQFLHLLGYFGCRGGSWLTTGARLTGWSAKGEPAQQAGSYNRGGKLAIMGMINARPTSHFVYSVFAEAPKGPDFLSFVLRHLEVFHPGDILVVDNGAIHTGEGGLLARQVLRMGGVFLMCLPTYSPELNPIELIWGIVKRRLRQECASGFLAVEELHAALEQALASIEPHCVCDSISHCGYRG